MRSLKNKVYLEKWQRRKGARGQRKENPVALRANQFAGFVTVPSEIKIISYDYRLLKRIKKRQQRHLNRILFLFAQKSTCLFVCLFAFFALAK